MVRNDIAMDLRMRALRRSLMMSRRLERCARLALVCAMLLALFLILSACSERPAGSETTTAVLAQWGQTLPTASVNDTAQTQREVALNRALYFDLCKRFTACAADRAG